MAIAMLVVAIDHVDESNGVDGLIGLLAGMPSNAGRLAIGRSDPGETAVSAYTATAIGVAAHQRQMFVDVLMAKAGIVERVESDAHEGKGRPPSRIELRFPPSAFRRLHDLRR